MENSWAILDMSFGGSNEERKGHLSKKKMAALFDYPALEITSRKWKHQKQKWREECFPYLLCEIHTLCP
jgi:hypothetical protein